MLRYIVLICFIWTLLVVRAQDPYSVNFSITEGLPSSNVYSIFKDDNGLLWFTTDVGIVRFDSHRFTLLNTDNGLSDNEIFRLFKDHKGRIWLQTLNGKLSYIYKDKIYNEHNSKFLGESNGNSQVMQIFERDRVLYIVFKNGEITLIDSVNQVSKLEYLSKSLSGIWKKNTHIYGIFSDGILNINTGKSYAVLPDKLSYRVFNFNGKPLLAKRNVIYEVSDTTLTPMLTLDASLDINHLASIDKALWVCTRTGVYIYREHKLIKQMFKDCSVTDVVKDQEGNFWISTLNKGVLMIPYFGIEQHLKSSKINCLTTDNLNSLWVGDYVNKFYHRQAGQLIAYSLKEKYGDEKITNIRIYGDTLYVVSKSGIYVKTKNSGFFYVASANDILKDGQKIYLASTSLFELDVSTLHNLQYSDINKRVLLGRRTNCIHKDSRGNIFIGTNMGLFKYTKSKEMINLGQLNPDLQSGIEDLFYDSDRDLLLVATASKGLIGIQENSTIIKFNATNGLDNNTCLALKKLDKNQFLISTNNGLNLLKFTNTKVETFNLNGLLGFRSMRIKDIEYFSDTICLATENGIILFPRNVLYYPEVKPICLIESFIHPDGRSIDSPIDYRDNAISIRFIGISYRDQGELKYYYKLDNEANWSYTSESQINYKSLSAGAYKFQVYCVNRLGQQSAVVTRSFKILKPFWQELWFQFLISLFVISVIGLWVKWLLNRQKRKLEQDKLILSAQKDKLYLEKQMIELEQKALRMQMNPHFIFNALNTIKGFYTLGNLSQASTYISKFSKLLRNLLENEEQVSSLDNEIDMLRLYIDVAQLRYQDVFDYTIEITDDIRAEDTLIPNMLLQPLVENAIMHGLGPKNTKGLLQIRFYLKDGLLVCEVEDNGVGRHFHAVQSNNNEHKSKALTITYDRIKLFDKDATFVIEDLFLDGESIGTKAIIQLKHMTKW